MKLSEKSRRCVIRGLPGHRSGTVRPVSASWGMTNGTAAAMLLSDLIVGRDNEWARLYDSTRTASLATKEALTEGTKQAAHLVGDRFRSTGNVANVAPGEGRIVGHPGDQRAVYRDLRGEVHAVSARCTHLGCIVSWNPADIFVAFGDTR